MKMKWFDDDHDDIGNYDIATDVIDRDDWSVHNWRVTQLTRLGVAGTLAEIYADQIDWHQIAALVRRGCPPQLALRIVV